jgi:ribosome-binding protein aMBF1 (putative translation factor)
MQQELDVCKNCAEYGSEFCEECLKDRKKEKAITHSQKPNNTSVEDKLNDT